MSLKDNIIVKGCYKYDAYYLRILVRAIYRKNFIMEEIPNLKLYKFVEPCRLRPSEDRAHAYFDEIIALKSSVCNDT